MIRPATLSDLSACLALGKAAFHRAEDKPTARWLLDILARPGAALSVCLAQFRVAGFLLTYPVAGGRTLVRMVATDPEHRRSGVARALVATVAAPGATWIRTENDASQGLFRSQGWERKWEEDGWQRWELVARPDTTRMGA